MKVYINPGHDVDYDPGAIGYGLHEADVAKSIGELVKVYLENAGCEVVLRQSDNLCNDSYYPDRDVAVVSEANNWEADVFVSIHCNSFNGNASGTECEVYSKTVSRDAYSLAGFIQAQLIDTLKTIDRGIKERPDLIVLKHTDMPAVLVETAFIDNEHDNQLLRNYQDEIARAIARGVTDYACAQVTP